MGVHQIIDRMPTSDEDSVTVLFDFDKWFKIREGTDVSPADMDYATSGSFLNDGEDVNAAKSRNKVLHLELGALRENAEVQLEGIQTLSRLLKDPRGQWFRWQDDGTVDARFFRSVAPSALKVNDLLLLEEPKRILTADVLAAPFAYGYPETGTGTLSNDPTAVNGMRFEFPPIRGDVPTPLALQLESLDAFSRYCVGVNAGPESFDTETTWAEANGLTGAGWAGTTPADALATGGVTFLATKTSGTAVAKVSMTTDDIPIGNYRVFARARSASANATLRLSKRTALAVPMAVGSTYRYYDLGVHGHGGVAPSDPPDFRTATSVGGSFSIETALAGSAGAVRVDGVFLVPAGLVTAAFSSVLLAGEFDVDEDIGGLDIEPDHTPRVIDGGFPKVVPGSTNTLFFVHSMGGFLDDLPDKLTSTADLNFKYYPLYDYGRSATG